MKLLWTQLQVEVKGKLIPIELSDTERDQLLPPLYHVEFIDSKPEDSKHHNTINLLP